MRGDEKLAERERRVISLVGGGGKTTTMYALAEIFREEREKSNCDDKYTFADPARRNPCVEY